MQNSRGVRVDPGPAQYGQHFRPDIQGLRGIAVLLVVSYHALGVPQGGFVGVDTFFVISGFLITGILAREVERDGRLSIARFYVRRARRILPAALVVIAVTLAAAFIVWFPARSWSVAADALASSTFVENWHLIGVDTVYLNATEPSSPLQHFWSLAVEEQFYALWPLMMVLGAAPLARRLLGRRAVLVLAVSLTALSMVIAAVETLVSPGTVYFDSVSRAWELGVGALVALAAPVTRRWDLRVVRTVFTVGLVVIVGSAFGTPPDTAFPWPLAILPVSGAAAVMAAGGRAGRVTVLLSNRPLRWLGGISYSLYLWHVPALVIVGSLVRAPWGGALAVVVSVVAAMLSERCIERPFRHPSPGREGRRGSRPRLRRATDVSIGVVMVTMLVLLGGGQLRGPEVFRSGSALASALGRQPSAPLPGPVDVLSPADLQAALDTSTTELPTSVRTDELMALARSESLAPALLAGGCRNGLRDADIERPRKCSWGAAEAEHTAVVVGDSIALSWTPAIRAALGRGWRVEAMGFASCPVGRFESGPATGQPRFAQQCHKAQERMLEYVRTIHPQLVLTSSADGYLGTLRAEDGATRDETWERSVHDTLAVLAGATERTVLLQGTPTVTSPSACATRLTGFRDCGDPASDVHVRKDGVERRAVAALAGAGAAVSYVPTDQWLRNRDGLFPPVIDGTLVRPDGSHLTGTMSARLGEVLAEALRT